MIVTVTPNAALDVTYRIPALVAGATHRVAVAEHAGGKGVNVARILHALGEPVVATGLVGGATGGRIRTLLDAEGVPHAFATVDGESRRTLTVVDPSAATGFWEPGPAVPLEGWIALCHRFTELLGGARAVVLAGSLPPGVPPDAYARLTGLARAAGVPVVLDAEGEPLRHGLAAGPDLVKPNAAELAGLVGPVDDPVDAVRRLGAVAVVASLGPDGLLASTPDGRWRAYLPEPVGGNPTGAGDACVAALVRAPERPWPDRLRDAVALSAAAVRAPVAGTVPVDEWHRLRPSVVVEET